MIRDSQQSISIEEFGKWKMGKFNEYCRKVLLEPQKSPRGPAQPISRQDDLDPEINYESNWGSKM